MDNRLIFRYPWVTYSANDIVLTGARAAVGLFESDGGLV